MYNRTGHRMPTKFATAIWNKGARVYTIVSSSVLISL